MFLIMFIVTVAILSFIIFGTEHQGIIILAVTALGAGAALYFKLVELTRREHYRARGRRRRS